MERTFETFKDVRDLTLNLRLAIGFTERDAWKSAPAIFDAHTLTIQEHPVMEDWEDGYMKMLAEIAASGGGTILEVGYGMGISARYIQSHAIDRHIIIEANREVFERLREFTHTEAKNVEPVFGFWEDTVRDIPSGSISGILFDTYPLSEREIHRNHFPFFTEAYRLLTPGGVLTYYSDEIDSFSPLHRLLLEEAGFTSIDGKVCPVSPPPECSYWKSRTLLVPVIRK